MHRIKRLQDRRCSDRNVCFSSWKAQLYVLIQFYSTTPVSKWEHNCGLQVQTLARMNEHRLLKPLLCKWQGWVQTSPEPGRSCCPPCSAGGAPGCPSAASAVVVCYAFVGAAVCWGLCHTPQKHQAPKGAFWFCPIPFLRSGNKFRRWNESSKWILTVKWDFYFC